MRIEIWLAAMVVATFGTIDCNKAEYQDYSIAPLSERRDHGYDHGQVGKHGGHVIELDAAYAYHGELDAA